MTYRDDMDEVATLRQELAVSEAACATAMAEVEALKEELGWWTSGRRRKGLPTVEAVPDGIQYAAMLARSIGTEGGEEHDRLLSEASQRMKALHDAAAYLIAERDEARAVLEALETELAHGDRRTSLEEQHVRLRAAARHVVDNQRLGNEVGRILAVDRLGNVLDGGT